MLMGWGMADDICVLSGLPIKAGQFSVEHYVPRSKIPYAIAFSKFNLRPAIKVFNCIKADRFPCEWEDQKIALCHRALEKWNLKSSDRDSIIKAIRLFEHRGSSYNPCQDCVLSIAREYCYARPELAKYRNMWLRKLDERSR